TILTAGLTEDLNSDPTHPTTTVDNGRLTGTKMMVPAAHLAATIIVPTSNGVFLVDPKGGGVELERLITTSGEPQFKVTLNNAEGEPLGDPAQGAAIIDFIVQRATAALCAIQLGV